MTPEQFQRVEELFHRFRDTPPEQRESALDEAFGDDPEVRAEVGRILAHADPQETLTKLCQEVHQVLRGQAPDAWQAPDSIEGYEILSEIHRGGQGVVYKAVQQATKRTVALKVLLEGPYASAKQRHRFEREIDLVASLQHPNIVTVYDSGVTSDRRHYFAMEYIHGRSLDAYLSDTTLNIDETLRLFQKICTAVNYAHQRGVIHRDLKPGNIRIDAEGEPHVLDFGLAKAAGSDLHGGAPVTMTGEFMGTLAYASPEQTKGDPNLIDIRTDVYSLGVVLYEMLTGKYPYEVVGQMADVLKNIAEAEPKKPSTIRRQINDEVETIVLKAIAKERERRYQSAENLGRDVERYLHGDPIDAKRDSTWYVIRTSLRRYRVAFSVAAAFVLLLGASTIALSIMRTLADQRYEEIIRLADLKRLADANAAANDLWPAHPERIKAMETWLQARAAPLRDNLPKHEAVLESLRFQALEYDPELRHKWKYLDEETQWRHDTLTGLVENLKIFVDPDPKKGAVASIEERLEFARSIEEKSITGQVAAAKWAEAIADIARLKSYDGLQLTPQVGLLPLRRDLLSGLWEVWHIQTGEAPKENLEAAAMNPWVVTADTGLVFVLIPGGTLWMGAQNEDPEGRNYDSQSESIELPVHEVPLAAFFISKYEMTQEQWRRFTGTSPSGINYERFDPVQKDLVWNPVEQVSWTDCRNVLGRLGLVLPTEAQWEYAARGGTSTVWWTGNEEDSILVRKAGNLSMYVSGKREVASFGHVTVGSYRPNGFGLHDTIGNVWEWCHDWYGLYDADVQPIDGVRRTRDGSIHLLRRGHFLPFPPRGRPISTIRVSRVIRGGGFLGSSASARSACRNSYSPENRIHDIGFRPARVITE